MVLGATGLVMLYHGRVRGAASWRRFWPWWPSAGRCLPSAKPYRMHRLTAFLDPKADQYHTGYQVWHALIALGSGGIGGMGLGEGREKLFIPEPRTDFIFPVIAEEWGLIGTLALVALFVFVAMRGYAIAYRTKDPFGALLAAGITTLISVQALINMAVATASIPGYGRPAAVYFLWRLVAGADAAGHRHSAEHLVLPGRAGRQGEEKIEPNEDDWNRRWDRGALTRVTAQRALSGVWTGPGVTPARSGIKRAANYPHLGHRRRDGRPCQPRAGSHSDHSDTGSRARTGTRCFGMSAAGMGSSRGWWKRRGSRLSGVQSGKLRRASSLRGLLTRKNLADAFRVPVGIVQAWHEVRRFRPDVVLATGGYVSVPPVIAAGLLRRPVLIHEQTVQIGLANQIAARFATRIALTFEGAASELPPRLRRKAFVTGNPVRQAIFGGDRAAGRGAFRLRPR